MSAFYSTCDDPSVLRERVDELSRIRQSYATHLGSSLYEATKSNEELRWGRESLYDGIEACDEERADILARIAELEGALAPAPVEVEDSEPDFVTEIDEVPEAEPEAVGEEPEQPEAPVKDFALPSDDIAEADEEILADEAEVAEDESAGVAIDEDAALSLGETLTTFAVEEPAAPAIEPEEDVTPDDVPSQEPESVSLTCPQCGAPVSELDRFCMTCGTSLVTSQPVRQNVQAESPAAFEPEATSDALDGLEMTRPDELAIEPEPMPEPEPEPEAEQDDLNDMASEYQDTSSFSLNDYPTLTPLGFEDEAHGEAFSLNPSAPAEPKEEEPKEAFSLNPPAPTADAHSKCPVCGAPVDPSDKFCMNCGTSLASAPAPKESKPKAANVCPNCGERIDPSFRFCMTCGYKLK